MGILEAHRKGEGPVANSSAPPAALDASAIKSALKKSGASRRPARHIEFNEQQMSHQTSVESFRSQGDVLWYYMPGSIVACDQCGTEVPQVKGSLAGEPTKSQFAQTLFLCSE